MLVVADFQSEYGIRLSSWAGSWAEFRDLLAGLMQADTRLWRHFQPEEDAGGR